MSGEFSGLEVIAIRVSPGGSLPYQYRGTSYLRVVNTTRTMSTEEYNRILFERMHNERRWENQPADGWTVEDLDVVEIRNTVAEAVRIGRLNEPGSREPKDLLRGLGLLRGDVLFRSAAVLFGNRERLECEMPQCLLRVARFRGLDRSEFLDNRQFNGNAFTLLASAERFLRETLLWSGDDFVDSGDCVIGRGVFDCEVATKWWTVEVAADATAEQLCAVVSNL